MGKMVFNGWHKIEEIEVEIKGNKVIREKLHLKSAVAGIVTDREGKIAFVKQFRPTLGAETLEIPAGVLDKPELTPLETMLEELKEECGISDFQITSCKKAEIPYFVPVMGSSDAQTSLYRIKLNEVMGEEYTIDDADVESVRWISFSFLEHLKDCGAILDGKSLLAYYILKGEQ